MRGGCGERPGQLGEQDLARRQGGEPGDAVGVDRPVAQDGAGDADDAVVRPDGIDDSLRGRRLIGAEGDGRGTDEERRERLAGGVSCGGDPHQPVLHDPVASRPACAGRGGSRRSP